MNEQEYFLGTTPTIRITECHGDLIIESHANERIAFSSDEELTIHEAGDTLHVTTFHDDVRLHVPEGAHVIVETVNGDTSVKRIATFKLGRGNGDVRLEHVRVATLTQVAGDVRVYKVQTLQGTRCDGDMQIEHCAECHIEAVRGDVKVEEISEFAIDHISGNLQASDIRGPVLVKNVAGDMRLRGAVTRLPVVRVGGDLVLDISWAADSDYRATVAGDVAVYTAEDTNLVLSATVSGDVRGIGQVRNGIVSAVLGSEETAARLELTVGGDLRVRGAGEQQAGEQRSWEWQWEGGDVDWRAVFQDFVNEMNAIGREVAAQFSNRNWNDFSERQAERARREAERAAERAAEAAERMRIRFNDREIHFDPERIERIKQQAQRAAEEGISRAQEAIERALGSLGNPPRAPRAPQPPQPPRPPAPPQRLKVSDDDGSATSKNAAPATGPTIRMDQAQATPQSEATATGSDDAPRAAADLTQERLAILRMVESGKITSDEAAMLLEALGS